MAIVTCREAIVWLQELIANEDFSDRDAARVKIIINTLRDTEKFRGGAIAQDDLPKMHTGEHVMRAVFNPLQHLKDGGMIDYSPTLYIKWDNKNLVTHDKRTDKRVTSLHFSDIFDMEKYVAYTPETDSFEAVIKAARDELVAGGQEHVLKALDMLEEMSK